MRTVDIQFLLKSVSHSVPPSVASACERIRTCTRYVFRKPTYKSPTLRSVRPHLSSAASDLNTYGV
eukprot:6176938-Pleurochrysis_carterae.AAC.1